MSATPRPNSSSPVWAEGGQPDAVIAVCISSDDLVVDLIKCVAFLVACAVLDLRLKDEQTNPSEADGVESFSASHPLMRRHSRRRDLKGLVSATRRDLCGSVAR